ncbi:MAG: hypothetical protein JXA99_05885 [Candidatus Lokiarchaeota archaeon]|nr:hypothetical protein [Candidatus Lokiarchaeota archaeon]
MPYTGLSQGKSFSIEIEDNATFSQALAKVDKYVFNHPEESIFPLFDGFIHNYLQLFWNPSENKIYEDCGIMPYGPDRTFMPILEDPDFILYPNSIINLQLDPGC